MAALDDWERCGKHAGAGKVGLLACDHLDEGLNAVKHKAVDKAQDTSRLDDGNSGRSRAGAMSFKHRSWSHMDCIGLLKTFVLVPTE